MTSDATVDDGAVRVLARAANLPLPADRVSAVVGVLRDWLPAAVELSRIMSAPEHQAVMPISVFTHPSADPTE